MARNMWLGLVNPKEKTCKNLGCEGVLRWTDGSPFIFEDFYTETGLEILAKEDEKCFIYEYDSNIIKSTASCDQTVATTCVSSNFCPGLT